MGRVLAIAELQATRTALRAKQERVVFTNGVFDIIHRGHIEYLIKAKSLGSVLVVGMNSDASVRRIKGETRPIVPQDDRAYVLANLVPVDFVCLFEEDTPFELIRLLVPDVLVKGADWSIENIVGKDVVEQSGGRVMTIEYLPNRSTTNIIEEVLKRFASASKE